MVVVYCYLDRNNDKVLIFHVKYSSFRLLGSALSLVIQEGVLFILPGKSDKVIRKLGHIISRPAISSLSPAPNRYFKLLGL